MNHAVGVDVVMSCLFVLCFYHPSVINTGLLQRFLAQTGGHSGGWDDYDQQLNKYHNMYKSYHNMY